MLQDHEIAENLHMLCGAVNTGVLVADGKALLIDCCDTVTPQRLAELGVQAVEMILCTQHRRPNVAGAYAFVDMGAELVAPAAERDLFDRTDAYWGDWKNRWHIYHFQPGPQLLATSIAVARTVGEGDVIQWRGWEIRVLDTPGATDGSVSYVVTGGGRSVCFCGDALYGPGMLWDICSLQKSMGTEGEVRDYHGFIGNRAKLIPSLRKLGACGADSLIPSHGEPMDDPPAATAETIARLDEMWRNYTSVSAMNFHSPGIFADTADDPARMPQSDLLGLPEFVRRVGHNSFVLISETGDALVTDCGYDCVLDEVGRLMAEGVVSSVEGVWVTHYHDDHVDSLQRAADWWGCSIIADEHLAEIVEHPMRFFLPCISPNGAPVTTITRDGESWRWHEFTLRAFHMPGQTYYHGGLLVAGRGTRVLFAGDSLSPSGVDDYCAANRIFLGQGKGMRRCIELCREHRPEYIFNQHVPEAFNFNNEQLAHMDATLTEREKLLGEMLPWANPNFGIDEWWARAYPFEQETAGGCSVAIDVQFTNHGPADVLASVEAVLPEGWAADDAGSATSVTCPPDTEGMVGDFCECPDAAARVQLVVPESAEPGRYVIPLRVTWGGQYLGQFRHAIVTVR